MKIFNLVWTSIYSCNQVRNCSFKVQNSTETPSPRSKSSRTHFILSGSQTSCAKRIHKSFSPHTHNASRGAKQKSISTLTLIIGSTHPSGIFHVEDAFSSINNSVSVHQPGQEQGTCCWLVNSGSSATSTTAYFWQDFSHHHRRCVDGVLSWQM